MLRRVSSVVVLSLLGVSASFAQQTQQQQIVVQGDAPVWVVSVVHAIDSNKMIDRLRQQDNVRVGVPGSAPRKLFNITTGLVIDGEGHVVTRLTNLDPSDKDETILVTASNGSRLRAQLIGMDCATGFAVLEVAGLKLPPPGFAPTSVLSLGMSVKILSADITARIAAPDNSKQLYIDYAIKQDLGRVTVGSIYAKARGALTLNSSNLLSRNDGSIVITSEGQVAGIAQYAGFGRAYLFPFEFIRDTIAKRVIDKQDSVPAGWLGVKVDGLTQLSEADFSVLGLARKSGVIVREVVAGSPAAAGGLKLSDVIVGLNEFDINSRTDLSAVLSSLPAGYRLKLRVVRNHDNVELAAVLGARPYAGQMVAYMESEMPDESLTAQRNSIQRRLEELKAQYRSNLKNPPSQARTETLSELDIEIRQLGDILRNLDLQVPPATTLASNDTGFGAPDQRAVVFPVGFTARDLDQTQEPQLAAFFGTSKGVLVLSVAKGTSAERTGIKAGDVIVGTYNRGGLNCRQLNSTLLTRRGICPLNILRKGSRIVVRLDTRTR
jgi:S1-C subfamily serine protease